MYPLQAFPTLSVLKDFTPYRGIILSCPIELTEHEKKRFYGSILASVKAIKIDTTFVLSRIAQEWNYDLELLKEGNGETGIADHSFVVYAHEKSTPQIIRWKQGKAQIILTIGARLREMHFVAIGNEAAIPTLDKLNLLFADVEINPTNHLEISTEVNNQVVKTVVPHRIFSNFFKAQASISIPVEIDEMYIKEITSVKLSSSQFRHYMLLANSCNLTVSPQPKPRALTSIEIPHLKINVIYPDPKEISEDILKIVYKQGISQCQDLMTYIIGQCLIPHYGTHAHIGPEDFCMEDLERSRWLDVQSKILTESNYSINSTLWDNITASINFTEADLKVLRGTGADIAQRKIFQDIPYNEDLLGHLVQSLIYLPLDLFRQGKTKSLESEFTVSSTKRSNKRTFEDYFGDTEERESAGYLMKINPLKNPYFSVHDGMPVRVDHTVSVWREIDKEALACDVWYDLNSSHLHVANLYRISVPTE
jgi:hypothetical protein